jgi:ppGpp synthetase/RelA/SpoT-type nucleotidyltranferase
MQGFASFQPAYSPLYMVMNDPVLHQFISYLAETKRKQEEDPSRTIMFEIPRSFIAGVRESFKRRLLAGESQLHTLAHVLSSQFLGAEFELHSNAIGMLPGGENRPFLIRERITRDTLLAQTDLDLGKQLVGNFRYNTRDGWMPLELAANFVEYIPSGRPTTDVNRLTSRVKAEEEVWNKVTDEIFEIDSIVQRDKHLQQFSKYIKDVFGIKIVCNDEAACLKAHARLAELTPAECDWSPFSEPSFAELPSGWKSSDRPMLEVIETKDYLTCDEAQMKKTGWRALKSVVSWRNQLFEVQVQPLTNYYLEIDHMSGPSHHYFKLTRDIMRERLSEQIPLYGFYRDLLMTLFLKGEKSFEHSNASVRIVDDTGHI